MDTYSASSAAPLGVRAEIQPSRYGTVFPHEIVQFYNGDQPCGVATVPRDLAYDLVSRLQDTPPALSLLTAEVAGHVRHVLERGYDNADDKPDDWTLSLITLIESGNAQQRHRVGLVYPAYVWAVAIGTGPDGLERLRHLHETVAQTGARHVAEG